MKKNIPPRLIATIDTGSAHNQLKAVQTRLMGKELGLLLKATLAYYTVHTTSFSLLRWVTFESPNFTTHIKRFYHIADKK
jgi:hypothetical protein